MCIVSNKKCLKTETSVITTIQCHKFSELQLVVVEMNWIYTLVYKIY